MEVLKYIIKSLRIWIGSVPLAPSLGVPSASVNSASLKGVGFDFSINTKIVNKEFSWIAGANFSYAKVKVTKIYLPFLYKASDFVGFGIHPSVGKVAYAISSYRWGGLDPDNGDPIGTLNGKPSKSYENIFNDTVNNQVLHGSAIPLYNGNLMNTLNWRQFSISFNILFKFNYYYRKPSLNYESLFSNWEGINEFENRWQKKGDEKITNVPSMIYPIPVELTGRDAFYQYSEVNVLRGDNIKLQDIRIQYSPVVKTLRFAKQINFYLYFNNLNVLLWKKDKSDYDPDNPAGTLGEVPPSKSITFGMNIGF